jgi:hypothetical protein
MGKLKSKTKASLDDKIDDILRDMQEVMKNHGFEDVSLTKVHFGPRIPGHPCSPPDGGKWTWVPGTGGYKLICQ